MLGDEATVTLLQKLQDNGHHINPLQLIDAVMLLMLGETLYSKSGEHTTLTHEQLSELTILVTSNLLEINKHLGNLSWLETNTDFFKIIDAIVYKTIYGLDSEAYEAEKYTIAWRLRRKINKVCSKDISETLSCFKVKKRWWQWWAPQATHPGPSDRINNILAALDNLN